MDRLRTRLVYRRQFGVGLCFEQALSYVRILKIENDQECAILLMLGHGNHQDLSKGHDF